MTGDFEFVHLEETVCGQVPRVGFFENNLKLPPPPPRLSELEVLRGVGVLFVIS
jgi:hypothetical protein